MAYEFTKQKIKAEKRAVQGRIVLAAGIGSCAAAAVASLYGLNDAFDVARAVALGLFAGVMGHCLAR